jgi:hypothetical protein
MLLIGGTISTLAAFDASVASSKTQHGHIQQGSTTSAFAGTADPCLVNKQQRHDADKQ